MNSISENRDSEAVPRVGFLRSVRVGATCAMPVVYHILYGGGIVTQIGVYYRRPGRIAPQGRRPGGAPPAEATPSNWPASAAAPSPTTAGTGALPPGLSTPALPSPSAGASSVPILPGALQQRRHARHRRRSLRAHPAAGERAAQ